MLPITQKAVSSTAVPQSLTDPYGRVHSYLRISVTDRCNLRCTYCMPPEGVALKPKETILNFEEIVRLTSLFARMGVHKVRLTGGEPLVRKHLVDLVQMLAEVPGIKSIAMTTNALLLKAFATSLRTAGLDRLNVSLDTLRPERFTRIALRDTYKDVRDGIDAAFAAGFAPIKLNAVIMGGVNDDEMLDFVELARHNPLDVRFIEYMPFQSNGWTNGQVVSYNTMRSIVEAEHEIIPRTAEDGKHAVAKEFSIEGFRGSVGFITSMTDHFCAGCNRLRLTADGALKTCLFEPAEVSLRDALRSGASDEGIAGKIVHALNSKPAPIPPIERIRDNNDSMIQIGG